jgi:hypothetical protein
MSIITLGAWLRALVGFDFFVCFAIERATRRYLPAAYHGLPNCSFWEDRRSKLSLS